MMNQLEMDEERSGCIQHEQIRENCENNGDQPDRNHRFSLESDAKLAQTAVFIVHEPGLECLNCCKGH